METDGTDVEKRESSIAFTLYEALQICKAAHWLNFPVCFAVLNFSHMHALAVIGRRVQGRGPARPPGVVEAVPPAGHGGVVAAATENDGATDEAEAGAYPTGVQREAERHQALLLVRTDRKPDRRNDPANRCEGNRIFMMQSWEMYRKSDFRWLILEDQSSKVWQ